MKNNAELHLIIPGICGPVAELHALRSSDEIKKWTAILAKATCFKSQESVYDVLTFVLGLQYENNFPSAELTLLANGYDSNARHYMHADPVHLQADLDHAILTSSVDLDIRQSEATALCGVLNDHFQQDGITFQQLNKDEWLLSGPDKIEMNTTPLSQAVGRNINFILPEGEGSGYWKKILTEAQMLMYSSDTNNSRENSGEQSVNSLWFHGAGDLPAYNNVKVESICSNTLMFKGLAQHIGIDYVAIPSSASDYVEYLLNNHRGRNNLLHLTDLEHVINYTDCNIWLEKLTELLDEWVYPLIKLAEKNGVNVMLYPCDNKQYVFSKYDAMKFWRTNKLDNHISSY